MTYYCPIMYTKPSKMYAHKKWSVLSVPLLTSNRIGLQYIAWPLSLCLFSRDMYVRLQCFHQRGSLSKFDFVFSFSFLVFCSPPPLHLQSPFYCNFEKGRKVDWPQEGTSAASAPPFLARCLFLKSIRITYPIYPLRLSVVLNLLPRLSCERCCGVMLYSCTSTDTAATGHYCTEGASDNVIWKRFNA